MSLSEMEQAALQQSVPVKAIFSLLPQAAKPFPSLWSKKMPGAISGLSASGDGKAVLVATSPDLDIVGSSSNYLLTWLTGGGRVAWQKRMNAPVKDQDLARDGSWAVISNYSDEVKAWSARGKLLWSVEGVCRPRILNLSQQILCYHDDDAEPGVAFDLLDAKGHKVYSYAIPSDEKNHVDVLALKVSQDERFLAVALTGGRVVFFELAPSGPRGSSGWRLGPRVIWEQVVQGEVVDVGISSGNSSRVAILYQAAPAVKKSLKLPTVQRKVAIYDHEGHCVGEKELKFASQVELVAQGDAVHYYGNGTAGRGGAGQIWGVWEFSVSESNLSRTWYLNGAPSEYTSTLNVIGTEARVGTWIGYDGNEVASRTSHLLSFDRQGHLSRDLPVASEAGSYLYAYRIVRGGAIAVVATDDARIALYNIN